MRLTLQRSDFVLAQSRRLPDDLRVHAQVAKSSLPPFLKNTYPSILEVFREARI